MRGLADGAVNAKCGECGKYVTRTIVLSNAPGDLKDTIYVLIREFNKTSSAEYRHEFKATVKSAAKPSHW